MSRKKADKNPPRPKAEESWFRLWSLLAGLFIAAAILKFSTPLVLATLVDFPKSWLEWLFFPWPNDIGYGLLAVVALTAATLALSPAFRAKLPRPFGSPHPRASCWLFFLPVLWWGWQWLSAASTIDKELTLATLEHFTGAVLLFYLGYFVLSRERELCGFRTMVLFAFLLVLLIGLNQHFGGLQDTREMIYAQPGWEQLPLEYREKIAKDRIFSTLFYPNAFAGGLILLTPLCAVALWQGTAFLQAPSRILLVGILLLAAAACLYWTESKSGWLVSLALVLVYLMQGRLSNRIKAAGLAIALLGGLAGFFWKYSSYFEKGAPSVAARFDYWTAAWTTAKSRPVRGAGPGTFMRSYAKTKPPQAEMARLAHNDYLQQASDSGFPGAALYAGMIALSLFQTRRTLKAAPVPLAVWFGLLGFALQSFVEFGLYIPALAWPFFLLLGWAVSQNSPTPAEMDGARSN